MADRRLDLVEEEGEATWVESDQLTRPHKSPCSEYSSPPLQINHVACARRSRAEVLSTFGTPNMLISLLDKKKGGGGGFGAGV